MSQDGRWVHLGHPTGSMEDVGTTLQGALPTVDGVPVSYTPLDPPHTGLLPPTLETHINTSFVRGSGGPWWTLNVYPPRAGPPPHREGTPSQ